MRYILVACLLTACSGHRLALSPDQCTAPTAQEAQITKSAWQ